MASTVILLGLAAAACSYARLRLVALVERVERDIAEQRRAEAALRQAERTAALAALGRELSGTLDPTQVAQRTVDSIARLLRAQAAALFSLEPASGALVAIAASGTLRPSFPSGALVTAGAGANGRAVALRRPVTADDVLAEPGIDVPPDLRERIVQAGVRAVCAVPLIVRDTRHRGARGRRRDRDGSSRRRKSTWPSPSPTTRPCRSRTPASTPSSPRVSARSRRRRSSSCRRASSPRSASS